MTMKEMGIRLFADPKKIAALSASFGALAGACAGATAAVKMLEKKYAAIADEEIAEAKLFYAKQYKGGDYSTPEQAAAVLLRDEELGGEDDMLQLEVAAQAMNLYQGKLPTFIPESTVREPVLTNVTVTEDESGLVVQGQLTEVGKNIFTDAPEAVAELDRENRDPEIPYLIPYEEFREGSEEYEQMELTYFEGDGILVDDADNVIMDEDPLVGAGNLEGKWGMGSHNNDIIYIRNEKLALEMEITRSHGNFAEEVAGILKHSHDRQQLRRFRGDDD